MLNTKMKPKHNQKVKQAILLLKLKINNTVASS